MIKNLMVLPEGTEIFSGSGTPAIQSVSITRCVNSGWDLTLGSVCPTAVEVRIIAPKGSLAICAGTEFALYQVDSGGQRQKIGVFIAETPVQAGENIYRITAYDRIVKLEKDLTQWLEGLHAWPYPVLDFARMVADACGLRLKNTALLNGAYPIEKFSARGITGRKLMEWIGQICAKFCRATPEGEVEFAWYTNRHDVAIAPSGFTYSGAGWEVSYGDGDLSVSSPAVTASHDGAGNVMLTGVRVVCDDGSGNPVWDIDDGRRTALGYYSGALSYEDYQTAPVEKVQLRLTEADVGVAYPPVEGGGNTYTITGNYLLTNEDVSGLQRVAEGIYKAICHVCYTPCKVSVPACSCLDAGDAVQITDPAGKTVTAYIMTRTRKGQRDTLECTGSPRLDSAETINAESFKAVSGKLFEVRKSIEGMQVKATALDARITDSTRQLTEQIAGVEMTAAGISASVSSVQTETAQNSHAITAVKESVTDVKQTAQSVTIQVDSILKNGVSKVATGMGYTFDEKGLKIQKPGEAVGNLLDNTGMYVTRSGETILQANASGVVATDVKVNNFLIVGEHARFEDYSDGSDTKRTACFWI